MLQERNGTEVAADKRGDCVQEATDMQGIQRPSYQVPCQGS